MKDIQTERRSIEFLKQPKRWGCWPACPVKRYVKQGEWPDMGVVLADGWIVYRVNLFMLTKEQLDSCEKHEYDSVEALVSDGWEVD